MVLVTILYYQSVVLSVLTDLWVFVCSFSNWHFPSLILRGFWSGYTLLCGRIHNIWANHGPILSWHHGLVHTQLRASLGEETVDTARLAEEASYTTDTNTAALSLQGINVVSVTVRAQRVPFSSRDGRAHVNIHTSYTEKCPTQESMSQQLIPATPTYFACISEGKNCSLKQKKKSKLILGPHIVSLFTQSHSWCLHYQEYNSNSDSLVSCANSCKCSLEPLVSHRDEEWPQ